MGHIQWERYPTAAGSPEARTWLQIQCDLGLAQNTIEAYGRALEDFFAFSVRDGFVPAEAAREHIARYVHDLSSRPNPRGEKIRALDSGHGLANATLQQRLTAIRLFYDYLREEGRRSNNPVGRGRYTPGKQFGGLRHKGLIPRYTKLPWIPNETAWTAILQAAKQEPLRNRIMLALGYDAGLRREELCRLEIRDIDPSQRLVHIRPETTKGRSARVVPYSEPTALHRGKPDLGCPSGADKVAGKGKWYTLSFTQWDLPVLGIEAYEGSCKLVSFTVDGQLLLGDQEFWDLVHRLENSPTH